MGLKRWNIAVLVAIGAIWFAGSTQREKRVVSDTHTSRVATLEDQAAASPQDAAKLRELTQAYLDARAPGMALAVVERAPASLRQDPTVEHVYARALLDQGRSADALAAEKRVLAACAEHPEAAGPPTADSAAHPDQTKPVCSSYLIASATRRADILEQLVQLGIEDANAHPEASNLAYVNATRQVSFTAAQ